MDCATLGVASFRGGSCHKASTFLQFAKSWILVASVRLAAFPGESTASLQISRKMLRVSMVPRRPMRHAAWECQTQIAQVCMRQGTQRVAMSYLSSRGLTYACWYV